MLRPTAGKTEKPTGKIILKLFLYFNQPGKGYVSLSPTTNTTVNVNDGENLDLAVVYEAYPKLEEEVWMYMNETLQNSSDHYVRITNIGINR